MRIPCLLLPFFIGREVISAGLQIAKTPLEFSLPPLNTRFFNLFSEAIKRKLLVEIDPDKQPLAARALCCLFPLTRFLELPLKIMWVAGTTLIAPFAPAYHLIKNALNSEFRLSSTALAALGVLFLTPLAALPCAGLNFTVLSTAVLSHSVALPIIEVALGLYNPKKLSDFHWYVDLSAYNLSLKRGLANFLFGGCPTTQKEKTTQIFYTKMRDDFAQLFHIDERTPSTLKDIGDALIAKGIEVESEPLSEGFRHLRFDAYNNTTNKPIKVELGFDFRSFHDTGSYKIDKYLVLHSYTADEARLLRSHQGQGWWIKRKDRDDQTMWCGNGRDEIVFSSEVTSKFSQLLAGSSIFIKNKQDEIEVWSLKAPKEKKMGFADLDFHFEDNSTNTHIQ